jgi:membrane associated rhomboid family serine protease
MPTITPTVKQILIGLVSVFVAQLVFENWLELRVFGWLAMQPGELMPWQLVTYVLVNMSQPLFFLIGLLFLAWALTQVELMFGRKRALQLCLVSALSASVPAWLLGFAFQGLPPLWGVSSLWYGAVATMCWIDRRGPRSLFGVVTMNGQQMLILFAGLSFLFFLADKDVTRLVGDLGAIAGGIGYANWLRKPRKPKRPPVERKSARASGFKVIQGGQDDRNILH